MSTIYKTSKIVMLPTYGKSRIVKYNTNTGYKEVQKLVFTEVPYEYDRALVNYVPQHLYFLSDDEIEEGDWTYYKSTNSILHCIGIDKSMDYIFLRSYKEDGSICGQGDCELSKCKNIISTTDKSLSVFVGNSLDGRTGIYTELATPSDEFLKKYCELGGIDEVLVDCYDWDDCPKELKIHAMSESNWASKHIGKPKINSDNTISIFDFYKL